MTRVVNIRNEKCDVYIGRGSRFGNPYIIGKHGNRAEVIELYRKKFIAKLFDDEEFADEVCSLKGKRLGCYCAPLPCHGDVIVELLEGRPQP